MLPKTGLFLTSLKEWSIKPSVDKTCNAFKVFMQKEYSDLKAVGGLSVQNSSLNLIKELKEHQEQITNNLRDDIQTGILKSMRSFNLASQNQENMDPNMYNMESMQCYSYPTEQSNSLQENIPPEIGNLSANQVAGNSSLTQVLQEMQAMQATINNLTLINQNLATARNNQNFKGTDNLVNPNTGLPWKLCC